MTTLAARDSCWCRSASMHSTEIHSSPDHTCPHSSVSEAFPCAAAAFGYLEGEGRFGSGGTAGGLRRAGGSRGVGPGWLMTILAFVATGPAELLGAGPEPPPGLSALWQAATDAGPSTHSERSKCARRGFFI